VKRTIQRLMEFPRSAKWGGGSFEGRRKSTRRLGFIFSHLRGTKEEEKHVPPLPAGRTRNGTGRRPKESMKPCARRYVGQLSRGSKKSGGSHSSSPSETILDKRFEEGSRKEKEGGRFGGSKLESSAFPDRP